MATTVKRMKKFDEETLYTLLKRAGEKNFEPSQDFFADQKNVMLVSYTNGLLSGFLWAYILQCPDKSNHKMFLYSIDVFDEFRRKGIASQLIRELKNIAKINNCCEMFVPTRKSNGAAVALYRTTGGIIENDDDVFFVYDEAALVS